MSERLGRDGVTVGVRLLDGVLDWGAGEEGREKEEKDVSKYLSKKSRININISDTT